jgi:hypothetical protein
MTNFYTMGGLYAPKIPVWLISIPQLGRDTVEQSYICAGGSESTLVWSDSSITLKHSPNSGVPFLQAYVGSEQLHAFCNMCYLAQSEINPTIVNLTDDMNTLQIHIPLMWSMKTIQ